MGARGLPPYGPTPETPWKEEERRKETKRKEGREEEKEGRRKKKGYEPPKHKLWIRH